MTERRKTSRFLIAGAAVLIAAAVLRMLAFSPGLEYDEIWTVRNYSARDLWTILNDLATPNNHPLNSLFVKWMLLFSDTAWSIRFPSFFAGLASVGLTGWLAVLLFRSRFAALTAMIFVAANPALILYSITARGYAVQTSLILLYAVIAALCYRYRRRWALYLLPVCGFLAELALPTSVLWLFPLSLVHCIAELLRGRKEWRRLLPLAVCYTVLGVILLFWLLFHYQDFKAGQSFGTAIAGVLPFFRDFLFPVWGAVCGWQEYGVPLFLLIVLIALPFVGIAKRRLLLGLLVVLLFPFVCAVFTLAGPARVYLASVPFTALISGFLLVLMMRKVFRKRILLWLAPVSAVLLSGHFYVTGTPQWSRVDWIDRFELMKQIPANRFLCVTATGAYPALWNNGEPIVRDYLARFHAVGERTELAQLDQQGVINGMNPQGSEDTVSTGIKGKRVVADGMELYSYRLQAYRGQGAPLLVFLRLDGIPAHYYTALISALAAEPFVEKVLILNAFFVNAAQQTTRERLIYAIAALRIRNDLLSQARFRKFYTANQRKFDFFTLSGDSE